MKEKILQILNEANHYGISAADFEDIADKIVLVLENKEPQEETGYHFMFDGKSYKGGTRTENTELIARLQAAHRPNIEQYEDGLYVCWNEHEKGKPCEYEKEIDYSIE